MVIQIKVMPVEAQRLQIWFSDGDVHPVRGAIHSACVIIKIIMPQQVKSWLLLLCSHQTPSSHLHSSFDHFGHIIKYRVVGMARLALRLPLQTQDQVLQGWGQAKIKSKRKWFKIKTKKHQRLWHHWELYSWSTDKWMNANLLHSSGYS